MYIFEKYNTSGFVYCLILKRKGHERKEATSAEKLKAE